MSRIKRLEKEAEKIAIAREIAKRKNMKNPLEDWTDEELRELIYCYDNDKKFSQELQEKLEEVHNSGYFVETSKALSKYTDEELDRIAKQYDIEE
ncbi:hypothetical protein D8M04_00700 [Oceanobacillus piezotolerans]|uniref:Uncharacterized protein n=1 Tax=Oceanobacillus piezotolerans TaxID=2448030 RepID=A0A498DC71_9BACI|nr:hypothetical protein [Oceanobacillus piezotolerans]RLL47832.1 hypothetical protein D8M04_00700 [Oceanobacillus piezotolerans]